MPCGADPRVIDRVRQPIDWLLVAGDLVADAPRTALFALASGDRAGRAAAGD
ncbi:MAG: hypothetical protein NVS3B10_06760 [Polyangiales bacterium]